MDQATASQWTPATDQTVWVAPQATHTSTAEDDFQAALDRATLDQADLDQIGNTAADQYSEDGLLPVEAYSLPDWYAAYIPKQCVLSSFINHAYWDQAEQFSSDGIMTEQEQSTLQAMLNSDQDRATELANESWRREHAQELSEYFDILHTSFREALRENGIEGAESYYHNVVLDPEGSEQVRQDMQSRLDEQPRFWDLMAELGVQV